MSTESIKVFVDKRLDKTVDFYYYQIIRRVIYNENKESFQKNTTSILNESDLLITRKNNQNIDNYNNIYDDENNYIGFTDWLGTVKF